jgi:hypothetical protein
MKEGQQRCVSKLQLRPLGVDVCMINLHSPHSHLKNMLVCKWRPNEQDQQILSFGGFDFSSIHWLWWLWPTTTLAKVVKDKSKQRKHDITHVMQTRYVDSHKEKSKGVDLNLIFKYFIIK